MAEGKVGFVSVPQPRRVVCTWIVFFGDCSVFVIHCTCSYIVFIGGLVLSRTGLLIDVAEM